MNEYPQGLDVPSRAHEKFYEGDIRTWFKEDVALLAQTQVDDLWDDIPPAIQSEIAEVLELYFIPNNAIVYPIIDGVRLPGNFMFYGGVIPIHRPRFTLSAINRHGSSQYRFAWGIRYRRTAPGVQGG